MWKDYIIVFTKKNQNSFHKIILLQYPFVNHEYCNKEGGGGFKVMVYNTTFNNISVISWQSVLLVEETWVPGENHRPVASHWQTLSHKAVLRHWLHR